MVNFKRLRSGQVWQQQRQDKHGREEARGAVLLGRRQAVPSIFFHDNAKHMHVQTYVHSSEMHL